MKQDLFKPAHLIVAAVFAMANIAAAAEPKLDPAKPSPVAIQAVRDFPAERPADNLTDSFTLKPLVYRVQRPFDLPLEERYAHDEATCTHHLWVYSTDKPHQPPPNTTAPRTELRLVDDDYKPNTGLHMLECDMFIVPGTFATISQVFGVGPMCIIIVDKEGTITNLRDRAVIARDMNGKWFNWKIIHDTSEPSRTAIKVYIDGKLATDRIEATRQASFYFKCGIYARRGSDRSEVVIRNLKYWVKNDTAETTIPGSPGAP